MPARLQLTIAQRDKVAPMIAALQDGGALFAQVYPDGLVLQAFGPEQASAVQKILGWTPGNQHGFASERRIEDL